MKVAQVGHSVPAQPADHWRTAEALRVLPPEAVADWDEDVINIADNGRDFLAERGAYDVVLVHSVIDPKWAASIRESDGPAASQVSPLDSYSAWRDRLVGTGARWIVIFEGSRDLHGEYESLPACLSGWHLDLSGYHPDRGMGLTVYTAVPRCTDCNRPLDGSRGVQCPGQPAGVGHRGEYQDVALVAAWEMKR